jgi:hypothetical protein
MMQDGLKNSGTLRKARIMALIVGPLGWFVFSLIFRVTPGQDWMVFDTAVHAWRDGNLGILLDGWKFTSVLNQSHAGWMQAPLVFHPWVYPPYTLLLALPFAFLPWLASYVGFQLVSLAGLLWALRPWCQPARATRFIIGGVLLCPSTAFTLGAGQNSFLTASMVLGGCHLLERRPVVAGCLFGLLAFKPQLAIMIPIALVASRSYRVLAVAAGTAAAVVLASLVVPGPELWRGWLHLFFSGNAAFKEWVDQGRLHGQSVFTCLRFVGLPASVANLGQLAAVVFCAACVWQAFRGRMPAPEKLATLLCAMILAAAHVGDYDAILLGIAATIVLAQGFTRAFRPYEAALAMLVWASTAINPPFVFYISVVTPLVVMAFMLTLCWRGTSHRREVSAGRPSLGDAKAVMQQRANRTPSFQDMLSRQASGQAPAG